VITLDNSEAEEMAGGEGIYNHVGKKYWDS